MSARALLLTSWTLADNSRPFSAPADENPIPNRRASRVSCTLASPIPLQILFANRARTVYATGALETCFCPALCTLAAWGLADKRRQVERGRVWFGQPILDGKIKGFLGALYPIDYNELSGRRPLVASAVGAIFCDISMG